MMPQPSGDEQNDCRSESPASEPGTGTGPANSSANSAGHAGHGPLIISGSSSVSAELRTDVLTGRQVIVAPIRSLRPQAVSSDPPLQRSDDPFQEGSEDETPHERLALRRPDSGPDCPGWQVRVVPNRYPAVSELPPAPAALFDENRTPCSHPSASEIAMLPVSLACGQHDVVIECPQSRTRLAELSTVEIAAMLTAWQLMLKQLTAKPSVRSVSVFRNEGFSAGASLAHCHSQIVASQSIPPLVAERHRRALQHRQQFGRDLVHDWLQAERDDGRRVVSNDEWLTVLCPFASRMAWNVRILSGDDQHSAFQELNESDLHQLAAGLRRSIVALQSLLGQFSFNLTLALPPLHQQPSFRWILDILPRTGRIAGWELLTDVEMIATAPESAAAQLRAVWHNITADQDHQLSNGLQWCIPEQFPASQHAEASSA